MLSIGVLFSLVSLCSAALPLVGVSESGMEFGSALPGQYGKVCRAQSATQQQSVRTSTAVEPTP